jgi:hypothetical protein
MLRDTSSEPDLDHEASDATTILDQIVIAAGQYLAREGSLWVIVDLLREYVGPPGENGKHNGAERKIKHVAQVLKETYGDKRGFGFKNLERYRTVGEWARPPRRLGAYGPNVHWAAGDWETLVAAEAWAKEKGVKLTCGRVCEFVARHDNKDKPQWIVE